MILLMYFENPKTQLSQLLDSRRKLMLKGTLWTSKRIGKFSLSNKTKLKFVTNESYQTRKYISCFCPIFFLSLCVSLRILYFFFSNRCVAFLFVVFVDALLYVL